jgi:hypothetical protein
MQQPRRYAAGANVLMFLRLYLLCSALSVMSSPKGSDEEQCLLPQTSAK